ncbi:peptidoglycan editing factor PgeF [Colwellia psychrerythraea]|uniref:Purine nucleoside phosphorylase n=1 Tax=Colwellia psychrerythraea TaxID=28229 RepID=A0A099KFR7_COLPS|nr:peptidoglycan editing factor PgeF [Colwellia psychrerythraea]KGJ89196.1 Multi-copper polyphenol oxidoreductase, laccase [Colwellia psychrerythraea]
MPKTIICNSKPAHVENESLQLTNSTFELVNWPSLSTSKYTPATLHQINDKVLALQSTRLAPQLPLKSVLDQQTSLEQSLTRESLKNEESAFGAFNLGLHVGDSVKKVICNRKTLKYFINQQLQANTPSPENKASKNIEIQWLEQVHGNEVVEVTTVDELAITADASITRQKNIALAIMTADCLPILLSHKDGTEIAAIHGGWRSLAANIITKTLEKMHSKPEDIVAWLGPCIGKNSFEVGSEVKEAFTQQNIVFNNAFLKQESGKYFADLHQIALLQLQMLGVSKTSTLAECTYHETKKYYSYRKEQKTGRMASLICRR